jgi:hypothetical protein
MKSTFLIFISFIMLLTANCKEIMESKDVISVVNNTNDDVQVILANSYDMNIYPDTMLPISKPILRIVRANNYRDFDCSNWAESINRLPSDTLSVYIFDSDTINAYEWSEIAAGYKILKRYDLSVQDLDSMNWTITYP